MKNILLVGMRFYNYDQCIKKAFEQLGNVVDYISDTPENFLFLRKIFPESSMKEKLKAFQIGEINRLTKYYDFAVIIVGRYLQEEFFNTLSKKMNANSKIILYLWDNIQRVENFDVTKKYVDVIYSFDPIDCYQYNFNFLPLFYTQEFQTSISNQLFSENKFKYDIVSALTDHSERLRVTNDICNQLPNAKLSFFVPLGRIEYLHICLKGIRNLYDNRIKFMPTPLPKEKYKELLSKSRSTLDIPYSGQIGLTIRTFESLASGVKLITTNSSIKYYDFYNPKNIIIINKNSPQIEMKDITNPYIPVNNEIVRKYSILEWGKIILEDKAQSYLKPGISLKDIYTEVNSEKTIT